MSGVYITSGQQLDSWVCGKSLHRLHPKIKGGECCPDFSCCKPALKAPKATRERFKKNPDERNKMLIEFLEALMQHEGFKVRKVSV